MFEPNLSDGMPRSESNLSVQSNQNKRAIATQSLECNHQIVVSGSCDDEHSKSDPSTSGTSQTDTTNSSGDTETTDTSGANSSTPTKDQQSQPSSTQSPIRGDGESSDGSNIQHQELQRSPPIRVPPPTRPLGHLGGNLSYFIKSYECTENGQSQFREGN